MHANAECRMPRASLAVDWEMTDSKRPCDCGPDEVERVPVLESRLELRQHGRVGIQDHPAGPQLAQNRHRQKRGRGRIWMNAACMVGSEARIDSPPAALHHVFPGQDRPGPGSLARRQSLQRHPDGTTRHHSGTAASPPFSARNREPISCIKELWSAAVGGEPESRWGVPRLRRQLAGLGLRGCVQSTAETPV